MHRQSIRRTALRAALSAPRAYVPKARPLSIASQSFASSLRPRAGIAVAVSALRAFSQTARVLETAADASNFDDLLRQAGGAEGADGMYQHALQIHRMPQCVICPGSLLACPIRPAVCSLETDLAV